MKIFRISLYLSAIILLTASCRKKEMPVVSFNGFAQGSTYSIVYVNNMNIDQAELRAQVEHILHRFDLSLSLYNDSSVISRINRNEDVECDSFFVWVFRKSAEITKLTDGAFDITVGSLVKAWGFGPVPHKSFTEARKDSLLQLTGMDKVSLVNNHIIKRKPGIILDANAIAQGFSVDVISAFLAGRGLKNYLVEIGGEVRVTGTKNGQDWTIGVDKPVDNNMTPGQQTDGIVKISDKALATSGNYRKFYVENGIKYSHEIDPVTGYPAKNNLLSATIFADDCATADGIATACMIMGTEKAEEFLKNHPQYMGYFIFSDEKGNFRTWMSTALIGRVTDSDGE